MEAIREAATCICVCCILCGGLKMLVPSASYEKLIRLAVGAFLVCSLVTPVGKAIKELKTPEIATSVIEENERLEEAVTTFTVGMLDRMVSGHIENALLTENVKAEDIEIFMDILEDGSISISQAVITLSPKDYEKREVLAQTVYLRTGVNVSITTEENE